MYWLDHAWIIPAIPACAFIVLFALGNRLPRGGDWLSITAIASSFFSAELDATYRFAVTGGNLTVRIEQEPSLDVTPVAEDEFEVRFESRGWAASPARLEFKRNPSGAITGFSLSSGSERGLVFEKQPALDVRTLSSGDRG